MRLRIFSENDRFCTSARENADKTLRPIQVPVAILLPHIAPISLKLCSYAE